MWERVLELSTGSIWLSGVTAGGMYGKGCTGTEGVCEGGGRWGSPGRMGLSRFELAFGSAAEQVSE